MITDYDIINNESKNRSRVQSFEETFSDKHEKSLWGNPVFKNKVSRSNASTCGLNLEQNTWTLLMLSDKPFAPSMLCLVFTYGLYGILLVGF